MPPANDDLIRSLFLKETRENLQLLSTMLGQLEAGLPEDGTLADASRAAHSLKGAAALLKFEAFRQMAAFLESCLVLLAESERPNYSGSLPLFQQATALLVVAADRIEVGDGDHVVAEDGAALLDQLQALQIELQAAAAAPSDSTELDQTLEILLTEEFEPVIPPASADFEQTLDALLGDLDDLSSHGSEPQVTALDELGSDLEDWLVDTAIEVADTPVVNFAEQLAALETAIAELAQQPRNQSPLAIGLDYGVLSALVQAAPRIPIALTLEPETKVKARAQAKGPVTFEQTLRVPVRQLDNLSNLVGEIVVSRNTLESDQSHLRETLENLMLQVHQLGDLGERMRELYERSLLETALAARRQLVGSPTPALASKAAAPPDQFDELELDRFSGFHSISQEMMELLVRLREAASDIDFMVNEPFDQLTRNFQQITLQLQDELNQTRMVPFSELTDQLPRAVREVSRRCGKGARLEIDGQNILIDKMILQKLQAPMTHLINNALSHGIESPEVRQYRNKPPEGTLVVRASLQGNRTLITVSDDGAGIDAEQVKIKAISKGLITPAEAAGMRVREIYELLFRPGFSTRDQADELAGRGVGLDVVRRALHEIQGEIVVDSELGKGTTFTFRLPLTLSITKALTCLHERARLAFPVDSVEETLDIPQHRLNVGPEGQLSLEWHQQSLPVFPLASLLQYHSFGRSRYYNNLGDEGVVSVVVLRNDNEYLAIQTDQIEGEREIVIKQIEGPLAKPLGILGVTIRSDGQVMPIVDVLELFDIAYGRVRQRLEAPTTPTAAEDLESKEPMVLIIDDSITVRELLSMTFKKAGYIVEQARNGQEALEKLYSGLPCDLVFCDIEMPKMNGLELLERMQNDPKLRRLPVAMLTSRGADRHRQIAAHLGASAYFTKPYLEEQLLDASARLRRGERLI